MRPSPTYCTPEGEKWETSVKHGLLAATAPLPHMGELLCGGT